MTISAVIDRTAMASAKLPATMDASASNHGNIFRRPCTVLEIVVSLLLTLLAEQTRASMIPPRAYAAWQHYGCRITPCQTARDNSVPTNHRLCTAQRPVPLQLMSDHILTLAEVLSRGLCHCNNRTDGTRATLLLPPSGFELKWRPVSNHQHTRLTGEKLYNYTRSKCCFSTASSSCQT